jgi:hypothetical protein
MLVNLLQPCHACEMVYHLTQLFEQIVNAGQLAATLSIHDNIPYCLHYKLIVKNFMYTIIQK